jgi:hypothetical protein
LGALCGATGHGDSQGEQGGFECVGEHAV